MIKRLLFDVVFTVLFGLHVLLKVFGQDVPWLWVTRLMFWFGERSGSGQGRRHLVDEFPETQDESVNTKRPFVVRGFFRRVAIEELVENVGGQTAVQTHSYSEMGSITDETISLIALVERIRKGLSTNAKSVIFPPTAVNSLLQGVKDRVDAMRGTTGMPWTDESRQFFIGGTDTFTRCHADPSLNCYLQLSGVKRWRLAPPSSACELYVLPRGNNISYNSNVLPLHRTVDRYPAYERVDWHVVDLHPGDLLVIPPFWFHEVQNRESSSGQKDVVVAGLAMNWLSLKHAWCQAYLMAAGSLLRPRLLRRYIRPMECSVDEDIMKSCRQVCSCSDSFGLDRDRKMHGRKPSDASKKL